MSNERLHGVFDGIEVALANAQTTKLRSALMVAIKGPVVRTSLNQSESATRSGVTHPRVSNAPCGGTTALGPDTLAWWAPRGCRWKFHLQQSVRGVATLHWGGDSTDHLMLANMRWGLREHERVTSVRLGLTQQRQPARGKTDARSKMT